MKALCVTYVDSNLYLESDGNVPSVQTMTCARYAIMGTSIT